MHRPFQRAALAAILCSLFSGARAEPQEVIVTATRFPETTLKTAGNLSLVSADDLRKLPALNLPDALKTVAGVEVRPLYGSLGIDTTVDVRGFGDTAGSNAVVLLDGQRLNPIDGGSLNWSTIPLAAIQRIEVLRGAGTVLYGDQASGGVINIITDPTTAAPTYVSVGAGSHGNRSIDAQLGSAGSQGYARLLAHDAESDGWRRNSQGDQQTLSGRAGLFVRGGEVFVDFAGYREASGLPSSLLTAGYQSDPTQTRTPRDKQHHDGWRVRPGISLALTDTLQLDADVAASQDKYHADNLSFASTTDRERSSLSLSPRLRWRHGLGGLDSETVAGIDWFDATVKGRFNGAIFITTEHQDAHQISSAVYVQNTTVWGGGWSTTLGARNQRMEQRVSENAYLTDFGFGPFPTPALAGSATRNRTAWDLGLTYQGTAWRAYGKLGTTFRYANTDELFGFDSFTGNPVFAGNLRPQHGKIGELGASFHAGPVSGSATLYRLRLDDEIGFDGNTFANVNFAPTQRQGLEAELGWRIAEPLHARLAWTRTENTFRDGPYAGNKLPLVARNKIAASVDWSAGTAGTYSAVLNHVGQRRYSGDLDNSLAMLPAYTTMDLQARWDFKPWSLTAQVINAGNKRYAAYAGYSTFRADYFYFPADERSFFVSARYDFE